MTAAEALAGQVGVAPACDALALPRASFYRHRHRRLSPPTPAVRPTPPRALGLDERKQVLSELNSDRFRDMAPAAVYA